MTKVFTIIFSITCATFLNAQPEKVYTSLEEALQHPQEVYLLDLSHQNLGDLPMSFGDLTNLRRLNLNRANITSLPESFGNLTQLTRLDLFGNSLLELPQSFGNLVNLVQLNLGQNKISELPESFGNLINLYNLSLYANQLDSLPSSFKNLITLKYLYLDENLFQTFPEAVLSLSDLWFLSMNDNQLTNLPEAFGKLKYLSWLYLNSNQFAIFPEPILNLRHLISLTLDHNNISFLPEKIDSLYSLVELSLVENQLTSLPEQISNLFNLRELNLCGNPITALPKSIANIDYWACIHLGNTPIEYLDRDGGKELIRPIMGLSFVVDSSGIFLRSDLFRVIGEIHTFTTCGNDHSECRYCYFIELGLMPFGDGLWHKEFAPYNSDNSNKYSGASFEINNNVPVFLGTDNVYLSFLAIDSILSQTIKSEIVIIFLDSNAYIKSSFDSVNFYVQEGAYDKALDHFNPILIQYSFAFSSYSTNTFLDHYYEWLLTKKEEQIEERLNNDDRPRKNKTD